MRCLSARQLPPGVLRLPWRQSPPLIAPGGVAEKAARDGRVRAGALGLLASGSRLRARGIAKGSSREVGEAAVPSLEKLTTSAKACRARGRFAAHGAPHRVLLSAALPEQAPPRPELPPVLQASPCCTLFQKPDDVVTIARKLNNRHAVSWHQRRFPRSSRSVLTPAPCLPLKSPPARAPDEPPRQASTTTRFKQQWRLSRTWPPSSSAP